MVFPRLPYVLTSYKIHFTALSSATKVTLMHKDVLDIYYQLARVWFPKKLVKRIHDVKGFKPFNLFIKLKDGEMGLGAILYLNVIDSALLPYIEARIKKSTFQLRDKVVFEYSVHESINMHSLDDLFEMASKYSVYRVRYLSPIILTPRCKYNRVICMLLNLRRKWNYFFRSWAFKEVDLLDVKKLRVLEAHIDYSDVKTAFKSFPAFIGNEELKVFSKEMKVLLLFGNYAGVGLAQAQGFGRLRVSPLFSR